MKTTILNEKKLFWLRGAGLVACLMALSMLVTACGKGGDSAAAVPPPVYPLGLPPGGIMPTCQTCPTNSRVISSVLSRGYSGSGAMVEMALDIYGDPNAAMQSAMTIGAYAGPFVATGYIFFQTPVPECGLPAGRVALQTVNPGFWGNDGAGRSGENITLAAFGAPVQIFLSGYTMPATPALQGSDGRMYPYSFQTTTMRLQNGAMPCTNLFLQ